jgi:predicted transposase/invertase (TIGR01784 family)
MTIFDEIEQEGIKQGIEQGIKKEKQNTIIRSWQNGIATPMISNITGLSIAEIEKVIANFQSGSQKSNF